MHAKWNNAIMPTALSTDTIKQIHVILTTFAVTNVTSPWYWRQLWLYTLFSYLIPRLQKENFIRKKHLLWIPIAITSLSWFLKVSMPCILTEQYSVISITRLDQCPSICCVVIILFFSFSNALRFEENLKFGLAIIRSFKSVAYTPFLKSCEVPRIFQGSNKRNNAYPFWDPCYPYFTIYKVGFTRVFITQAC